ncbi:MAG: hypothetical protein ACRD3C_02640 [Vicinamibacterales bacterium]
MDREVDLIRSEIDETRANLEQKLSLLEARAREMTPRRLTRRLVHKREFEQVVGGTLVLAGALMAWRTYRRT